MVQDVTLHVTGMTCNHCKAAVTRALSGLDGVQSVDVDLASKQVQVKFDGSKLSLADLKNAVTEAGYDVQS